MASLKKKTFNILLPAVIASLFCQIGMALTCVNEASVMHMPSLKNTVIVFAIAVFMAIGIEVLLAYIVDYTNKTAAYVLIIMLFLLLAVLTSLLRPIKSADGLIAYRYPMLAAIGFGVLLYQLFHHKLKPSFKVKLIKPDLGKPEAVFTFIALALGMIICIVLPTRTMTCVDDDSHYKDSMILSEGIYTAYNEDDTDLIFGWDESKYPNNHIGAIYVDANPRYFLPNKTGYLGSAIGLWMGRILGLSINGVYFCGRVSGLFIYTIFIYFAIKRLINGKLALGLICLSPMAIQYAVGYSYDAWLMEFTALSLAYYFGALQRPDEKLSTREIIIIIGAMFIGTWPKMPYAVLFLLLLVMPNSKFINFRQKRLYYLCISACIVAEIMLIFLTSFGLGDVADTRGGSDVSAYGQIAYIINNPREFIATFKEALKDFLISMQSHRYLTDFGFFGNSGTYALLWGIILVSGLLDNEVKVKESFSRLAGIITVLILSGVVVVLMYLSFTSVGVKTIQGVQPRYKIQLIFPLVMSLLSGLLVFKQKWLKKGLKLLSYGISTFCLVMTIVGIV